MADWYLLYPNGRSKLTHREQPEHWFLRALRWLGDFFDRWRL